MAMAAHDSTKGTQIKVIGEYFDQASEVLQYYHFRNETHKVIWELHCEGMSVRKIADYIKKKKFTKSVVNYVIQKIEKDTGLKRE